MNTMNTWRFFVRLDADRRHQVFEASESHMGDACQWQIAITGHQKPTLPPGLVSEGDYLRWRGNLADNGYTILDTLPFGSATQS